MPQTLRNRLLLGYVLLALLSVVLASSAALALFGRRLVRDAQAGMVDTALAAASRIESWESDPAFLILGDDDEDPGPDSARALAVALRRTLGPSAGLIVDGEGQPAEPFQGADLDAREGGGGPRGRGFGSLGGPGSGSGSGSGSGRGRPPLNLSGFRFPPVGLAPGGRPSVERLEPGAGPALFYTTAPVPGIAASLGLEAAHVVVVRPSRELRGMWLTMVPSVALAGSLAVLAAGLVAAAVAGSITRPIEAVTAGSARLAGGDHDVRVPVEGAAEFRSLAHSFNAMAFEVGQAHDRQRDFVVNVSHDLRTPLTTIRGFAEALRDGTAKSQEQQDAAARAIAAGATRMAALVEELLDLARLEGQQGGLERSRVALSPLIEDITADLRGAAGERDVRFLVDVEKGLTAWADRSWLSRALLNLIGNGVVHGPRGGTVRITVRSADAQQGAQQGAGVAGVSMEIQDEGNGISAAQQQRIFERFYRGDPARSAGGSGLGLAIAREIIEAHGGFIEVGGDESTSTTFSVWLPGPVARHPA